MLSFTTWHKSWYKISPIIGSLLVIGTALIETGIINQELGKSELINEQDELSPEIGRENVEVED